MTLDLERLVPDEVLAEIAKVSGTYEPGVTVGDIIRGEARIGYGGHFDETSDEEDAVHAILALDDEHDEIAAARQQYTNALRDAMEAVEQRDGTADQP